MLRLSRKGGRDALEPLSPPVERALDSHLAERTTGPLFVDDRGWRMYEAQAWRLVRRLARRTGLKAGWPVKPAQPAPHLRHQFRRRRRPAPRHPGAMGHANPRTTRRYMATHQHLDRHATYAFAAWLRRSQSDTANDDRSTA